MYTTGLSFHVASIFEEAGYTAADGFAVFLPSAGIALLLRPFTGWAADRFPVRILFLYLMTGLTLSGLGLAGLGEGPGKLLLIVGNGMAGSIYNTLMSITWPNLFGRTHLGAISGLAMSVAVFTSALGPMLFSFSLGAFDSYRWCGMWTVGLTLLAMVLSVWARDPQTESE
jgi:MFS family permease